MLDQRCGIGSIGIDPRNGVGIGVHKLRDGLRFAFNEFAARHHNAGDHGAAAVGLKRIPFGAQIQRHTHFGRLGLCDSDERLRQQRRGVRMAQQRRQTFAVLRLVLDVDVLVRFKTVGAQNIVQRIFGRCAFAGGIDGASLQVGHAVYIRIGRGDIQYAQRVHGQRLELALHALIEHGGEVCRKRGDVDLALGEPGGDFIRGGADLKFIIAAIRHHFDHAHGRRPLQRSHARAFTQRTAGH